MVEYSYARIWQGLVYHSSGPQVEFVGAKLELESVVLGGYQVLNIGGGGVHGVRESPNGLYTNDTMQYLLGLGLRKLRSPPIIHGVRHAGVPSQGPKGSSSVGSS